MNFIRLPLLWSFFALGLALSLRAADGTATLSVMSPEGAKILIDGKDRGTGPAILRDVPAGKRLTVRVEVEGRPAVERELTLTTGRITVFDFDAPPEAPKAEPAPAPKAGNPPAGGGVAAKGGAAPVAGGIATVSVMAQDGATVLVDGAAAGYAPVTLRNLPAGKPLVIRLELTGHEALERTFTLSAGSRETFEVELQPIHPGFELTTLPGAEVIAINEQGKRVPIGFTDEKGVITSEGKVTGVSCTLEITKQGYEPYEQKVTLDPKNRVKLSATLRAKPARLQIVSVPSVNEVLVNGQRRPVTRGIADVPADADLTIEVKLAGYASKTQKARVAKGEEAVVNFGNLDPLAGGVRVAVVTDQGPVNPDFHTKVRAFVDSREVPWNRGVLGGLAPGKHEITLMHESYNVAGDGVVSIDVKESAQSDVTMKVEMKPARLRIAVQAKGKDGKLFKPAFGLSLDGLPLDRSPDEMYDVPAGREFTIAVSAITYTPARRTFGPLTAGDEQVWEPVIEYDTAAEKDRSAAEARGVRLRFEGEMAVLVKESDEKLATLRKSSGGGGPTVLNEARQWTAARRQVYADMEKRYGPGVFTKNAQFEQNLVSIEKVAETVSQMPKKKTEAPSPF